MKAGSGGKGLIINILSLIGFLLLWYVLVILARNDIFNIPFMRLRDVPTPLETWYALIGSLFTRIYGPSFTYGILEHTGASLQRVIEGGIIAFIVGVPLGIGVGYSKLVGNILNPIIEIVRNMPPMAWIPLAIFILVTGGSIFIVFIGMVFPIILNTVYGVKSTDPRLIDAAKTLGASESKIVTMVVIPSALPSIIAGLRIGLGVGWMAIVAAEMVIRSPIGLGYFIWNMGDLGRYAEMVAGMIVIGVIGYLMNGSIILFQKRFIKWVD
ncbi:MAG: ABC transporter permease [Candidatus Methanoperedens sp.]|nr:ABC transporter permease [Candidatus Methanoperedens sp.]MCZ7371551.1 ABC transporter permease [Candidatus Methanoperedens sp.]